MTPSRDADAQDAQEVVSWAEFTVLVRQEMEIDGVLEEGTSVYDQLEFDSLNMYELLVLVEDLGVELDEEQWLKCETLGEFYGVYLEANRLRHEDDRL